MPAWQSNLVLPAHDYVLKCSHTFNVLDTRGAIGVTERQAYFGRMRDLSRRVAEAYLEQRQQLEYPWLDEESQARRRYRQRSRSFSRHVLARITIPCRLACSRSARRNCRRVTWTLALEQLQGASTRPVG